MNNAEWWFAALTILAVGFILWAALKNPNKPDKRNKVKDSSKSQAINSTTETELERVVAERITLNNALYAENLKEIDAQLLRQELSQDQYEKLKVELQAQLNQDNAIKISNAGFGIASGRWVLIVVAILIPLLALGLYVKRGNYADWEIDQLVTEKNRLVQRKNSTEQISKISENLLEKLEDRIEKKPDNLNNWVIMARTAFELKNYQQAIAAYQNILDRQPNSPQMLSELAQVIFVSSGNRFIDPVKDLFDRALTLEPNNPQVLSLAGFDAYQAGDYKNAIVYWERILAVLPPNDKRRATWSQALNEAKKQAGIDVAVSNEEGRENPGAAGNESADVPFIDVTVALAKNLENPPANNDTVFIYARAANGPKMPLAMVRLTVADLPTTVRLDESKAMAAGMTISQFPRLEVVARVSKSGTAAAQSGDWQAIAPPISTAPNLTVELLIDTKIP